MRKSFWAYNMIGLELYADLKQLVLQTIKHTCSFTLTIKEKSVGHHSVTQKVKSQPTAVTPLTVCPEGNSGMEKNKKKNKQVEALCPLDILELLKS